MRPPEDPVPDWGPIALGQIVRTVMEGDALRRPYPPRGDTRAGTPLFGRGPYPRRPMRLPPRPDRADGQGGRRIASPLPAGRHPREHPIIRPQQAARASGSQS